MKDHLPIGEPITIKENLDIPDRMREELKKTSPNFIKDYTLPDSTAGFYQTGNSATTPEGYSVTSTNPNNKVVGEINMKEHLKTNPNKPFSWGVDSFEEEPILYDAERAKKFKELNPNFKVKELFKNYNKNNIYEWDNFFKDKTLNEEEEHCNVGVNKDWENYQNDNLKYVKSQLFDPNLSSDFTEEQVIKLNKYYDDNWNKNDYKKEKRVDFECNLKFWQLLPSAAINLVCKEIEITWLCFGMYINWK